MILFFKYDGIWEFNHPSPKTCPIIDANCGNEITVIKVEGIGLRGPSQTYS
jgi:hypothetical protein